MKLSTKQKAYLKSLGQTMQPTVRIGKLGMTPEVTESAEVAIKANELIKVKVLSKTSPIESKEALQELAKSVKAEVIQTIGHNGLLYRKNDQKNGIEFPS
ncbi:MAG: YhbY family RNA-binding protein [Negativicutes bacterium]|jgi:RNA-binding protein|nr:YhbY family RNA-binding protein [Negativicutes bacterium]